MCSSAFDSSRSALIRRGWRWPRTLTAMLPSRSQYSRPSASVMRAPLPLRGWKDVRTYVPRRKAFSRSSTAAGDSSCSNKVRTSLFSNSDSPHARSERVQRGLQLGPHAAGDDFRSEERFRFVGVQLSDDVAGFIEQAGDVGDENQFFGAERNGDRGG